MIGIVIITILAFILGIILILVDQATEQDYLSYLPGYNCGACGFGSCKGMSDAMQKNIENYQKCRPMKEQEKRKIEEQLLKK